MFEERRHRALAIICQRRELIDKRPSSSPGWSQASLTPCGAIMGRRLTQPLDGRTSLDVPPSPSPIPRPTSWIRGSSVGGGGRCRCVHVPAAGSLCVSHAQPDRGSRTGRVGPRDSGRPGNARRRSSVHGLFSVHAVENSGMRRLTLHHLTGHYRTQRQTARQGTGGSVCWIALVSSNSRSRGSLGKSASGVAAGKFGLQKSHTEGGTSQQGDVRSPSLSTCSACFVRNQEFRGTRPAGSLPVDAGAPLQEGTHSTAGRFAGSPLSWR